MRSYSDRPCAIGCRLKFLPPGKIRRQPQPRSRTSPTEKLSLLVFWFRQTNNLLSIRSTIGVVMLALRILMFLVFFFDVILVLLLFEFMLIFR
ncbi:MAG: hypothetical protein JWL59_1881 [Chthoniobacteraceae bacterium]|nr:hypothetical protein [Chthoniobacteraceae bacterium]